MPPDTVTMTATGGQFHYFMEFLRRTGEMNAGRPYAAMGMWLFCVGMAELFRQLAKEMASTTHGKWVRMFGIGTMVYAALTVTRIYRQELPDCRRPRSPSSRWLVNGRLANPRYFTLTVGSVCVYRSVQSGGFPEMREQEEQTDLAHYKTSGQPFKLYWMGVGKFDIANANSAATVSLLRKYGLTPTTKETGGYHAWTDWRDYLHEFAAEIFR